MLTLKKIAITGGLAAGKSTVCNIFRKLGAYVVDADEIVHKLISIHTSVGKQIASILGPNIIVNNELSREEIAKKVFDDPEKLKTLENLIHPYVLKEIDVIYTKIKQEKKFSLFVVEVPLLFEIKMQENFDCVVAVIADEALCKNRFAKGETEYEKRQKRQLSQEEKQKKADFVLMNNEGLKELEEKVKKLYFELNLT